MENKPQFTVIETETQLLMTPPEFSKFTGIPIQAIKEKCKQGIYPHIVKYSRNFKPFIKILVPETLAIIKKECLKNAPFMPQEKSKMNKSKCLAVKVISKALSC